MTRALLISTSLLASISTSFATTAQAASNYTSYATHIYLNGKNISNPYHIVAKEYPTAKQSTSWLAIWYLMQALKLMDIQSTWNGETWNLELPSGMSVDLSLPPKQQRLYSGQMAISVNGTTVQYTPRISYRDPGGNVTTSYTPIWYLMQVLRRVGIQCSWDGTNWKMAQGNYTTKLDVVKNFVSALHINLDSRGTNPYDDISATDWPYIHAAVEKGYFQADSATHFGATDSVEMSTVDYAYQAYIGIPDSEMGWQAGGNLEKWSNIVGLNNGISLLDPMSRADLAQMNVNLTHLFEGYFKGSNGTYHLVFKPYNVYLPYHQNPHVSMSFAATQMADAIQQVDAMTFTLNGNGELYKIHGLSDSNLHEITIGNWGTLKSNTYYSLNAGRSWNFASGFYGYDSRDSQNGGVSNAPAEVQVKDSGETIIDVSAIIPNYDSVPFAQAAVKVNDQTLEQILYSSGAANYSSY